jgi:sterol desaturase/sphingolipid hydroxylase (fatty acid hydroxylase superfamily)
MWPSPYGLFLGYLFVVLGQAAVLLYYVVRRVLMHSRNFVQVKQVPSTLAADLLAHVSAPESFVLVFGEQKEVCGAKPALKPISGYLAVVWMFQLLPSSYYDLEGGVSVVQVVLQFLVTDLFTYGMHRLEHAWPALYQRSHKAHHQV